MLSAVLTSLLFYAYHMPVLQHALKSSITQMNASITQMNARLAALLRQPRAYVSDASSAAPSSPPSSLPSGADDLATFALLVQQLEERVRVATTEGTAAMHALAKAEAGAKEEQATMRLEIQARDAEIQLLHTKRREQEKDKVSTPGRRPDGVRGKIVAYCAHSLSDVNFAIRVQTGPAICPDANHGTCVTMHAAEPLTSAAHPSLPRVLLNVLSAVL